MFRYGPLLLAFIIGVLVDTPVAQAAEPWEFHLTPYFWAS